MTTIELSFFSFVQGSFALLHVMAAQKSPNSVKIWWSYC